MSKKSRKKVSPASKEAAPPVQPAPVESPEPQSARVRDPSLSLRAAAAAAVEAATPSPEAVPAPAEAPAPAAAPMAETRGAQDAESAASPGALGQPPSFDLLLRANAALSDGIG